MGYELNRRQQRKLRRRIKKLNQEVRITAIKIKLIKYLGGVMLQVIGELSEQEAALSSQHPGADAKRTQYVGDKLTRVVADQVDGLADRWNLQ